MILYNGVVLSPPSPDIVSWAEATIATRDFYEIWNRLCALPPGLAALSFSGALPDGPQHRPVRLGRLWWPRGASRWSSIHLLVDDAQLLAIRGGDPNQGLGPPLPFALSWEDAAAGSQTVAGITTNLLALPPLPLAEFGGANGYYLLTLVDERFLWWQRTAAVIQVASYTTWTSLYQAVANALGIVLETSDIPPEYLKPSGVFSEAYEYLPPFLDAIAYAVGQRIVRDLDGTVFALSFPDSLGIIAADLLQDAARSLIAGGPVSQADSLGVVASEVAVIFGGGTSPLVVPTGGTALATKALQAAAYAGVTEDNADDLAARMAIDYAAQFLGGGTWKFAGVVPWEPDGINDAVEWAYSLLGGALGGGEVSTRIYPPPWNDLSEGAAVFPPVQQGGGGDICCQVASFTFTITDFPSGPCRDGNGTYHLTYTGVPCVWSGSGPNGAVAVLSMSGGDGSFSVLTILVNDSCRVTYTGNVSCTGDSTLTSIDCPTPPCTVIIIHNGPPPPYCHAFSLGPFFKQQLVKSSPDQPLMLCQFMYWINLDYVKGCLVAQPSIPINVGPCCECVGTFPSSSSSSSSVCVPGFCPACADPPAVWFVDASAFAFAGPLCVTYFTNETWILTPAKVGAAIECTWSSKTTTPGGATVLVSLTIYPAKVTLAFLALDSNGDILAEANYIFYGAFPPDCCRPLTLGLSPLEGGCDCGQNVGPPGAGGTNVTCAACVGGVGPQTLTVNLEGFAFPFDQANLGNVTLLNTGGCVWVGTETASDGSHVDLELDLRGIIGAPGGNVGTWYGLFSVTIYYNVPGGDYGIIDYLVPIPVPPGGVAGIGGPPVNCCGNFDVNVGTAVLVVNHIATPQFSGFPTFLDLTGSCGAASSSGMEFPCPPTMTAVPLCCNTSSSSSSSCGRCDCRLYVFELPGFGIGQTGPAGSNCGCLGGAWCLTGGNNHWGGNPAAVQNCPAYPTAATPSALLSIDPDTCKAVLSISDQVVDNFFAVYIGFVTPDQCQNNKDFTLTLVPDLSSTGNCTGELPDTVTLKCVPCPTSSSSSSSSSASADTTCCAPIPIPDRLNLSIAADCGLNGQTAVLVYQGPGTNIWVGQGTGSACNLFWGLSCTVSGGVTSWGLAAAQYAGGPFCFFSGLGVTSSNCGPPLNITVSYNGVSPTCCMGCHSITATITG